MSGKTDREEEREIGLTQEDIVKRRTAEESTIVELVTTALRHAPFRVEFGDEKEALRYKFKIYNVMKRLRERGDEDGRLMFSLTIGQKKGEAGLSFHFKPESPSVLESKGMLEKLNGVLREREKGKEVEGEGIEGVVGRGGKVAGEAGEGGDPAYWLEVKKVSPRMLSKEVAEGLLKKYPELAPMFQFDIEVEISRMEVREWIKEGEAWPPSWEEMFGKGKEGYGEE